MIVNVTRGDLRDEFSMADEAFALSPISARAAQPSEQDYDAISEAFMETSRGRWFLGEYGKRNRNADTRMVLDAVARIEQSLAAQKQPEPEVLPDTGLADAIAAIKDALGEARVAAAAAIDGLALQQHLAPVRKGARVIREISWRWREIGADGRICDLLDSQVSAIEASCGEISSADPHAALGAAFDLIGKSIAAFDESNGTPAEDAAVENAPAEDTVEPAAAASPAPSSEMPAADIEPAQPLPDAAEAAADTQALPAETVPVEAPVATAQAIAETHAEATEQVAEAASVTAQATDAAASPAAEFSTEAADISAEDADAHDEAVLDMIAAEMAAYDPSDEDGEPDIDGYETQLADSPAAEPEIIASTAEKASWETSEQAPEETLVAPEIAPAIEPVAPRPQPTLEPEPEPSLGSTLIANGLVRKPATAASDPLAAIRRLSQIEKIALFS
jgi:hypothetical protein